MQSFFGWIKHRFSNPDLLALFLLLAIIVAIFAVFGNILMPIIASIVIAYLLQWGVRFLEKKRFPHLLSVILIYALFLTLVVIALLGLLPALWHQLTIMINQLPYTLGRAQTELMQLPQRYPDYVSTSQVQQVVSEFQTNSTRFGQWILSTSLASIPGVIEVIVYLVLVPLLVYFFLMDQQIIWRWFSRYMPRNRRAITHVWTEVHDNIGNYVGGKILEMFIVWVVSYFVFWLMGLPYAMVLSALVGVSVIVPYIGAVVVTVPVLMIAFLQWGWSPKFAYLVIAYGIIITLDANVLVPLLFSEVVALHPIAIIIATLVFGKLWGFWGVFFAIPLAILVKAILNALPRRG